MAMKSRRKGKVGEREVAQLLRARGLDDARRGQQFKGGAGSPDVVGLPGYHIEVKRAETFNPYMALDQALGEKAEDEVAVVFHRRSRKAWLVVLDAEDFLDLVSRDTVEAEGEK